MDEEKTGLSKLEYDFAILRGDFKEMQERVATKLMEIEAIKGKLDAKAKKSSFLADIDVKKLLQLKQLGYDTKGLLTSLSKGSDGEEAKEEQNLHGFLP